MCIYIYESTISDRQSHEILDPFQTLFHPAIAILMNCTEVPTVHSQC